MPSKHMQRRRAYLLNRLKVPPGPDTAAMLKRVSEAVMPPREWDGRKPYKPPRRTVTVTMPAGWVDMAEYLAPAQSMTRARFLSTLMGEQLYDIWEEARKQYRQSVEPVPSAPRQRTARRAASPSTTLPQTPNDLDDDIPF